MPRPRKPASPFRRFNSSPEVIRLVVLMYVRFPLSLRNVEDLFFERGIDICHEMVRQWWNRFGPLFAGDSRLRLAVPILALRNHFGFAPSSVSLPDRVLDPTPAELASGFDSVLTRAMA